jgi:putative flavoprotein involved in K+ transport
MQRADTVIIGGGQAGLALSRWLTAAAHDHVVLERGQVGERWRSERWDSLSLLTPNWANRLPGDAEPEDPDAFLSGREFVEHLERYARSFGAPVREHTTVVAVERTADGFRVRTDSGDWTASSVVLASGDCAVPSVPWIAGSAPAGVRQMHASAYRSPASLPAGGVMVVGAGPSGHQIADELARAGRKVVLAVGRHARIPRRYRGRDIWAWMRDTGHLARTLHDLKEDPRTTPSPTLPLDGRQGGRTVDLGTLHALGVRIAGRVEGFAGAHALFAPGLHDEVARAEERLRRLLARIDVHIASRSDAGELPAPAWSLPVRLPEAPATLDLDAEQIKSIVWATGYRPHHPWLRVPEALAGDGSVAHRRGVTSVDGLYILGTRWQYRTISHQIGGVGEDAEFLADHILERAVAAEPRPLALAA